MNYQQQRVNTMQESPTTERSIAKLVLLFITLGGAAYVFGRLTAEIKEEIDLFGIKT